MKKRVIFLLLSLWVGLASLLAQDVPVGVVVAFKKGSSQELNRYLGEKVDLVILSKPVQVDKVGAEGAISDFFTNNKVSRFDVKHQGKRDESSFIVGTLQTANGNFRVNCFFRKEHNRYFIHQIRIDKTNE